MKCVVRDCSSECEPSRAMCDPHVSMCPTKLYDDLIEAREWSARARTRVNAMIAVLECKSLTEDEKNVVRDGLSS